MWLFSYSGCFRYLRPKDGGGPSSHSREQLEAQISPASKIASYKTIRQYKLVTQKTETLVVLGLFCASMRSKYKNHSGWKASDNQKFYPVNLRFCILILLKNRNDRFVPFAWQDS